MRGTIHLVTADDALALPRLVQPVLDAELRRHRDHAPVLERVDLGRVLTVAREILRQPHTAPQLRAALAERFPNTTPPRWHSPAATTSPSSRCHRAGSGVAPAR